MVLCIAWANGFEIGRRGCEWGCSINIWIRMPLTIGLFSTYVRVSYIISHLFCWRTLLVWRIARRFSNVTTSWIINSKSNTMYITLTLNFNSRYCWICNWFSSCHRTSWKFLLRWFLYISVKLESYTGYKCNNYLKETVDLPDLFEQAESLLDFDRNDSFDRFLIVLKFLIILSLRVVFWTAVFHLNDNCLAFSLVYN